MFFSVLIPVYNAEKYLDDCLKSVLNQTEKDYEIIIINDGSTDRSGEICDQYKRDFENIIRVRHTSNNGLITTRYSLIALAQGDYLIHLDADDYLRPDTLKRLKETIKKYSADLLIYGLHRIGVDKKESNQLLTDTTIIYEGEDKKNLLKAMCKSDTLNNYVTKVASRDLALKCEKCEQLSYVSVGEDLLQSLPLVTYAKRIVYLGEPLYCYRKNDTSITATIGIKRYESEKVVYRELMRYSERWGIADDVHSDILKRYSTMCIDTLIISVRYRKGSKAFFDLVSSDSLFQESRSVFHEFPLWKRLLGYAALKGYYKRFEVLQGLILQLSKMKKYISRGDQCRF